MLKICIIVIQLLKRVMIINKKNNIIIRNCIRESHNIKTNKQTNTNEVLHESDNIVLDKNEIPNIFNTFFVNREYNIVNSINLNNSKRIDWNYHNNNCYNHNQYFLEILS